uniref:O-methylsterigmatocystin oxidoreductase n=1 Tax=Fusarium oxysporum (strain Fo5176) TaxID=660025 RepID=A0A0D2YBU3_FUSOF
MAGQAMDDVTAAGVPGAFLVDILPLYWVPGANFKRLAKKWSSELDDLTEKPYAFVKHQHASGKQDNSFVSRLLEVGDSTEEARFTTKWSALSLYAAGADTKKAQEEIDGVIGNERLPNCSDRQSLPYVNAIVKEVLRWHPVAPMGLPHTSTVDDVFEGYFVPKDALIMPNIWSTTSQCALTQNGSCLPTAINLNKIRTCTRSSLGVRVCPEKTRMMLNPELPIYSRDDQPPRAVQSRYYAKIATPRTINPVSGARVPLGTERRPYHREHAAPSIVNPKNSCHCKDPSRSETMQNLGVTQLGISKPNMYA